MPADTSLILAKVETVPGTYVEPAPATDAQVVFDYTVTPMESEQVRRSVERGFSGINPSAYTAIRNRHQFSVELTGSGTVDTPAPWARLLQACQFGAAVPVVTTEVGYPLVGNDDGGSLSIAGLKGDARHKSRFARGNAIFHFAERGLPGIEFDFQGIPELAGLVDSYTPVGLALPTYPAPVEVSLLNTVVKLGSITLGVRSLDLNMGNMVEYFSTTGRRAILFGKDETGNRRAPSATAVFEMPELATKNYFPDMIAGTPLAFELTHGTVAGNIIEITSSRAVLGAATYSVEANRLFLNAELEFVASASGNDFTLKTK